jgi:hypothetical protein
MIKRRAMPPEKLKRIAKTLVVKAEGSVLSSPKAVIKLEHCPFCQAFCRHGGEGGCGSVGTMVIGPSQCLVPLAQFVAQTPSVSGLQQSELFSQTDVVSLYLHAVEGATPQ